MRLPLVVCFLHFTFQILALPGLEDSMKRLYPETKPSCTTCHDRPGGELPSSTNVTKLGKAYYQEILDSEKGPQTNLVDTLTKTDFVVYGDSRSNLPINKAMVDKICSLNPKKVFHTGDMVADGENKKQWLDLLPIYDCLLKKKNVFHHSCGNHEGRGCLKNPIRAALKNHQPFYTVELNGFTFIALDSHTFTGEQLQWLSKLPIGKHYIPFFHHPAYPTLSGHRADPTVLKEFVPRFKRLKVKLVFTGHNHGYDRAEVDGVQWVTAGGGGAPLYPCGPKHSYTQSCLSAFNLVRCETSGTRVACVAKTTNDTTFDSFTVDYK